MWRPPERKHERPVRPDALLHISNKSTFGEGQAVIIGDDQMVEHADVDQLQRLA